ncbi:MAG: SRPBCC family protein [Bacteroidetes bacterium]|nr:SRPBCC family protein [Bacteroidota bacterium]
MRSYTLHRQQQIPADINTVWDFFATADNLQLITPQDMNFRILAGADGPIRKGQIIKYKVAPLFNMPLSWTTEITKVEYLSCFVDEQLHGPYKLWRHRHDFRPNALGVLMTDTVTYVMPFGILGSLAHATLVKRRLHNIFDYRYRQIEKIFSAKKQVP